jgi:WD40 repeat protein
MKPLWTFLALGIVPAVAAAEPAPQLKLAATLDGVHPAGYGGIAFSPDGKLLAFTTLQRVASNTPDGDYDVPVITLWDMANRKERATLRPSTGASETGIGYAVAFDPDGKTLAVAGAKVTLFDVATGKEKASFKDGGPAAFSPDGKTVAAVSGEHTVTLWDLSTGKEKVSITVTKDRWFLCSLAFSPDGKLLAAGSGLSGSEGLPADGDVTLWDADTGKMNARLTGRVKLRVTLESLSSMKAGGVPKRVLLKLAALNGKEFPSDEDAEKELPGILDNILTKEQREKYLNLVQHEVAAVREVPVVWAWALAFSPDGKTLASGDLFGNVLLWDVASGTRRTTLQRRNPRGEWFYTPTIGVGTDQPLMRGRGADFNSAYSVAFSPDGRTLAAGTLFGIKAWDVDSGETLVTLSQPAGTAWSVAFSPDGKTIASSGTKGLLDKKGPREGDATIRLWEWAAKHADK